MTRSTALHALLLATSTLAPVAAAGQTAPSAAAQTGKADAIRVLLDQAGYWRAQYRDDKASERVITNTSEKRSNPVKEVSEKSRPVS